MKYPRSTRQALIISLISTLLSFTMLVSTTYAWLTDSVSSDNNIIQSGSLDVELQFAKSVNGELSAWKSVSGRSDIFDPYALWEPGRAEVVYLKVSNPGTLALKYRLFVNIIRETVGWNAENDEIRLSDYLVFKVIEMDDALTVFPDRESAISAAGVAMGLKDYNGPMQALQTGKEDYVALIVYMPAEVGNVANYRGAAVPSIELGINLVATQVESESDSFGSDYDKDAEFPKKYGLLIDKHADIYLDDYNFDSMSSANIDALVHVTDGSEVNLYGKTTYSLSTGGLYETPVISSAKNSTINIYGGRFSGKDIPIIDVSEGTVVNIYRGFFRAEVFSSDGTQTSKLLNYEEGTGCAINVQGGTFVNYDPRATHLGNLVAEDHIVLTTERENGEIWYTVVPEEYAGYTPVFDTADIQKAFNDRAEPILIAGDIDIAKDTESLLRGPAGHTLVVDGMGATITPDGTGTRPGVPDYGYVAFIPNPGDDAIISNMKFVGTGFVEIGHHGEGGGTYEVTNLVIENLNATLHIDNGGNRIAPAFSQYGTATLIDCIMTGTTTEKVGYKPYDAGFVNSTKTFIRGGRYGTVYMSNHAQVTLNDTEIDTIDCYVIKTSSGKGKLTIGAGTKIGTLNVFPYGSYAPSIVIEEGVEIGEINYKGVTYTIDQWIAAYS